jgi:cation diffusion facilitator family transporter
MVESPLGIITPSKLLDPLMPRHAFSHCRHLGDCLDDHRQTERASTRVLVLTSFTMLGEIAAGISFGSMAVLADGWHMGTHVAALGITVLAYRYARNHMTDPRFTFGTGKVGVLSAFASAVALAVGTIVLAGECVLRLFNPTTIRFNEALIVAILGLVVNLISARLLGGHHEHDHNVRAAYAHVLADALTSFLAVFAVLSAKLLGWVWIDPVVGLAGAVIIMRWSYQLLTETGPILLDAAVDPDIVAAIRAAIESDNTSSVDDLHIWRIGPQRIAAIVSVRTPMPKSPADYEEALSSLGALAHVTVEVYTMAETADYSSAGVR